MLEGAVNVLDYAAEDYMVLANYIQSFPVNEETGLPTITAADGYMNVNGEGRIVVSSVPVEKEVNNAQGNIVEKIYEVVKGDSLWKISRNFYGTGSRWGILYDANRWQMPSPDVLQIGQKLLIP